ncbi:MAG: tRNA 2-thiouridine(34) synthase MnmA [Deltaproteobacteria bacterium]|nr:tRNA 2-thiouridine(34) synthase MnmA [Deltaproteobacteria bacterium]MCB9786464.1 tRNA 2-thiouridine(34) synthase MnmA [Deltaproteobacteria bacterium]
MSGGVDSSTVAGLMVEAGHDVIGVMMKLYDRSEAAPGDGGVSGDPGAGRECCGLDDAADARRVADTLGIPFYVSDYQEVFRRAVIDEFVDAYVGGRTPNPCVRCNDAVKFKPLLARARKLGAEFLATGHYVRADVDASGRVELRRAVDAGKDQSYFVAGIAPEALARVVFPLGGMTKQEVRGHAERLGLPVAHKPDSQEICFVPDGDHAGFVAREAAERVAGPGALVSLDGTRLGQHRGLHHYTVGQRRGLGIADAEPYYVVGLRPERNEVIVGRRRDVTASGLVASRARWLHGPPAAGAAVTARVRHRHAGAAATVLRATDHEVEVAFSAPVGAVAPGQQLVLYDGDRVLGAATIDRGLSAGRTMAVEPLDAR